MSYPPNVVQQQPAYTGMGYPYPAYQPQPGVTPNPPPGYADPNQATGYPQTGFNPNAPPAAGFPGYPNPGQGNGYPPPGYPIPQGQPPPLYNPQTTVVGMQPMGNSGQGDAGWMPAPTANPNCPPGLEYLTLIDQLLVHQKVEMLEAFVGFETANKYEVKNSMGQKVFYAAEISDCCTRMCCGPLRSFEMKVVDNLGHEVIHFNRPLACTSCFFPCCLQTMDVCSPPGNVIGSIKQDWSVFAPKFSLKNAAGETVLRIQGPFCTISCCGDVEFDVLSLDGTKVGKISKQWSGFVREAFTDADNFGISFPLDLDVKMKAVLLGACFLIDYMFFEKKGNKENDGLGMWS